MSVAGYTYERRGRLWALQAPGGDLLALVAYRVGCRALIEHIEALLRLPRRADSQHNHVRFTMKQIIDGKTFDTDTAQHVCDLECRANRTDFAWHETALYRSPRGQFFIAGNGGPASRWARPAHGGGRTGGGGMQLIDEAEARRIMEEAGCDEADFGAVGLGVEEG
jgi:hypothetical protein